MTDIANLDFDPNEAQYNARDVLATARIWKPLVEAMDRTNTVGVYVLDKKMAKLALQMKRAGMPVDAVERKRVGDHLREIKVKAEETLRKYVEPPFYDDFVQWVAMLAAAKVRKKDPAEGSTFTDPASGATLAHSAESALIARTEIRKVEFLKTLAKKGVNFGAKAQQAALLRAAGVPLIAKTKKTGQLKIDKDILEGFGYNAAARAMLEWTLVTAALKTFVDGLEIGDDGRLHPDWSIHKITGRWGSNPNVQNWSKRAGGGAENLRRMIAAPEGYIYIGADQKQLEARFIAGLSQDPFLLDIFRNNKDIHSELAGAAFPGFPQLVEVYNEHKPLHKLAKTRGYGCGPSPEQSYCDYCAARDKQRDLTKRLEYGVFYGGLIETLWASVVKDHPELKLEDVRNFMNNLSSHTPGVTAWRQRLLNEVVRAGEIRSPILGRRQVFPMGRFEPTVIYNYKCQSGAADLWEIGADKFVDKWDQTRDEVRIIHNGHDSVLILTKLEFADAVEADVHTCWELKWNSVDFLMDCKRGQRWSEV